MSNPAFIAGSGTGPRHSAGLCWLITDGSAGMLAQARALAEALGVTYETKTIALNRLFSWQPNAIYASGFQSMILDYALDKKNSDALAEPWPELVISCGRKAGLVAMGMRSEVRNQKPETRTQFIHIQDPQCPASNYDLVIAMVHDKIRGPNVINTRFALHGITPEKLAAARAEWEPRFAAYPSPRVAVLLGGSTNKYTLSRGAIKKIISDIERLLAKTPCSLLITPSRRTGEENIKLLDSLFRPRVYIYDGKGDNPYMGLLALADAVVVTNDSVNMMSEAAATGKPLYILPLPGHKNTKPARFAEGLIEGGIARPFSDTLEKWSYLISDEMQRLAAEVTTRLGSQLG